MNADVSELAAAFARKDYELLSIWNLGTLRRQFRHEKECVTCSQGRRRCIEGLELHYDLMAFCYAAVSADYAPTGVERDGMTVRLRWPDGQVYEMNFGKLN